MAFTHLPMAYHFDFAANIQHGTIVYTSIAFYVLRRRLVNWPLEVLLGNAVVRPPVSRWRNLVNFASWKGCLSGN